MHQRPLILTIIVPTIPHSSATWSLTQRSHRVTILILLSQFAYVCHGLLYTVIILFSVFAYTESFLDFHAIPHAIHNPHLGCNLHLLFGLDIPLSLHLFHLLLSSRLA